MEIDEDEQLIELVDEFLELARKGESPSLDAFCEQHPSHADELREVIPALGMLEELHPEDKSNDSAEDDLPENIGDYQIIGQIGRGGMGVVYEAEQLSLKRRVALKVLPQSLLSTDTARLRFQREARAAAKMHHTNIVPVFDVGQQDDYFYYAMQLIRGQGLDEVITELNVARGGAIVEEDSTSTASGLRQQAESSTSKNAPSDDSFSRSASNIDQTATDLSFGDSNRDRFYVSAARLIAQAADATAYAHARGVIHRDIKPSNLLLDAEGVLWVADFGLAKTDEEDATLTQSGDYLGTLRYMSPERFRGVCDESADIYALGLTLYELLLRRPAFQARDRMRLIYLINNTDPDRPRSVEPDIPRDLETIVLKAIDKEPSQRYASAVELQQDLQRFINDEPIQARRTSVFEQASRWARRNKALATALTGIAALLLTVIGLQYHANSNERTLRQQAEAAEQTATSALARSLESERNEKTARKAAETAQQNAEDALTRAEAQDAKLNRNLYMSDMLRVGQHVDRSGLLRPVIDVVDRWRPAEFGGKASRDVRNWEWYFLQSVVREEVIVPKIDNIHSAAWSADGRLVSLTDSGEAGIHLNEIFIYDAQTGALVRTLEGHTKSGIDVAWCPVNNRIVSAADDQTVRIWDPDTGECLRTIGPFEGPIAAPSWDPQAQRIAVAIASKQGATIHILREDSSLDDAVRLPPAGTSTIYETISWSPDGTLIASGPSWAPVETAGRMTIWDVSRQEIARPPFVAAGILWKPVGHEVDALLMRDESGDVRLVDAESKDVRATFDAMAAESRHLQISRDQKHLMCRAADHSVRVWNLHTGHLLRTFQQHKEAVWVSELSPAGDRGVSHELFGHPIIWSTQPEHRRTYSLPVVHDLDWHPDSNLLAMACDDDRVRILNVDEGTIVASEPGGRYRCAWSPDGSRLAFVTDHVRVRDMASSECVDVPNILYPGVMEVDWHPTERKGVCGMIGGAAIFDLDTGESVRLEIDEIQHHFAVAWNPANPNLLAISTEHDIVVRDLLQHTERQRWPYAAQDSLQQLRWSPDGRRLVSAGRDGSARVWNLDSQTEELIIRSHNSIIRGVAWNPDCSRLATVGNDSFVRIWDTETGNEVVALPAGVRSIERAAWSPNGRRIAAGTNDGQLIVWDASTAYIAEGRAANVARTETAEPRLPPLATFDSGLVDSLVSPDVKWSQPVKLGPEVNSPHNEFEPALSFDGLTLLFHSNRPEGVGRNDLWMSERSSLDDAWQPATNLGDIVNSAASDEAPFLSADGNTLYFASNRENGNMDLWTSTRPASDAAWSSPVSLAEINSSAADTEPTVSADGLTLLFASTRQPKSGIFDIWMSTRTTTTDRWSAPVHLRSDAGDGSDNGVNLNSWQGSPTLSADGSVLIYHSGNGPQISTRATNQEPFAIRRAFDSDNQLGGVYSPCLSSDGRILYYRRHDPDTDTYNLWTVHLQP